MTQASATLDKQINDYLLTASGHLKDSKPLVSGRQVAAFGVAASSALAMMSQAEAAVVMNGGDAPTFGVINGAGTGTFAGAGYRLFDMDGDGSNDFAIWGYSGGNNGIAPATSGNAIVGGVIGNDAMKLGSGFDINATAPWTGSAAPMTTSQDMAGGTSGWTGGASEFGFVGVRFNVGANTHYGWICLRSNGTPGAAEISVIAYAYENTPDAAIAAGDRGDGTPVACSAALAPAAAAPTPVPVMAPVVYGLTSLALGGLGLAGLRRRREALKAEQTRH
ncbi:MAG: hypothetical protein QG662_1498 [Pseudomonadota bacterium]|nr:hypothetical protein [Pseudomonadota bacterium]